MDILTGIIKHHEHMNAGKLKSATEQDVGDFGRDDGDVAAGLEVMSQPLSSKLPLLMPPAVLIRSLPASRSSR
ncbi:hypothetical protein AL057_21130 [Pseudomonas amygdali pv. myricae]|nr:hypothetical protein AL057_21130 [Pseudomonas amygdali pv. myricae]